MICPRLFFAVLGLRFPSFHLHARLAKSDVSAPTQVSLSVQSEGFNIEVDPSIVPHIGGLQVCGTERHLPELSVF
jgi:hypothetical protein